MGCPVTDNPLRIVIVGAGHAGGAIAAVLRQYGYTGPICLIGAEPLAPYQRPPLSKAWLKGEADADSLMLKPLTWYAEAGIDLRLDCQVIAIDRERKTVTLTKGAPLPYDRLIFATGARAIRLPLPGGDLDGILELRTAADADALKRELGPGRRLAIIGGGYVGLEVAASARALGAEVVVIEREARVLARVACAELSTAFTAIHRQHGVTFALGGQVIGFEGNAKVSGVRLADHRLIPCDVALVGVGAVPNDELAKVSGIDCDRGILVDLSAQTSDPSIYAIGDVTQRPLPLYGRRHRLESVPNALEQARQAACAILGRPAPLPEVPWFWSDQYDLKLQIAGLPFDAEDVLVRGQLDSHHFALFHLKGDHIRAVEAVNSPPEFIMGKQLIANNRAISRERLANPSISMKEVAA